MAQRPVHYPHMAYLLVGPDSDGSPLALLAAALRAAGSAATTVRMPNGQEVGWAVANAGVVVLLQTPLT